MERIKKVLTDFFYSFGKAGAMLPSRLGNYEAPVPKALQKMK